jgi:hypothetical protein
MKMVLRKIGWERGMMMLDAIALICLLMAHLKTVGGMQTKSRSSASSFEIQREDEIVGDDLNLHHVGFVEDCLLKGLVCSSACWRIRDPHLDLRE